MSQLFRDNPPLGEQLFRTADTMMMLSGFAGEIHDANNRFLDWIGYSLYEFTREVAPVTWIDLTLQGADLEADQNEAVRCQRGEISAYRVRKHYLPKNGLPKLVELYVRRYPEYGDEHNFTCFIVEVNELGNRDRQFYEEFLSKHQEVVAQIGNIYLLLQQIRAMTLYSFLSWAKENPKLSIPLGLLLLYLLADKEKFTQLIELKKLLF